MKIAVIGARGFVGSNISDYLSRDHNVTRITRDTLNVLDSIVVKSFLNANLFDVVINCAAVMTNNETLHDARNNFGMFMNFYDNKDLFGKFINTASGAEFDRTTNINCADEHLIFERMPNDSYGWGQNMKSRICATTDRFYNIRIFNCFGSGEISTRIFPKFLNSKDFSLTNDRYFDYFSIQDLCTVVEHCSTHVWDYNDVNAVYMKKYRISEVLTKFSELQGIESNFLITSTSENNYTGNGSKLMSLDIKLQGLEHSLKSYKGQMK
jgi:GDP-L-fucose synthase